MSIQPIEEFTISNQNLLVENPSLPNHVSEHHRMINVHALPANIETQQPIEQPQFTANFEDKIIQEQQLMVQPNNNIHLPAKPSEVKLYKSPFLFYTLVNII